MNNDPKDGGPAFPNPGMSDSPLYASYGMSLRDWLAGQALAGLCANPGQFQANNRCGWSTGFANEAYALADAMLASRRRGKAVPDYVASSIKGAQVAPDEIG